MSRGGARIVEGRLGHFRNASNMSTAEEREEVEKEVDWMARILKILDVYGLNTLKGEWRPNARAVVAILFIGVFYVNDLLKFAPRLARGEFRMPQDVEMLTFVQTHGITVYRMYFLVRRRRELAVLVRVCTEEFGAWRRSAAGSERARRGLGASYARAHWVYVAQAAQYFAVGTTLIVRPLVAGGEPDGGRALIMQKPLGRLPMMPVDESAAFYAITYVLQSLYMIIAMSIAFSSNMMFFTLSLRVCAHIEHLAAEMEALDDPRLAAKTIKKFVQRHNTIKEYIDLLNRLYSTVTAVQPLYGGFSIITSFLVFDGSQQSISFVGIAIAHTYELFVFCYAGNLAEEMSLALGDKIFGCPWWIMSPKDRKSVLIIVQQCQRPFFIKSGFFGILSMGLFSATMKTTYSIWAVVNQAK